MAAILKERNPHLVEKRVVPMLAVYDLVPDVCTIDYQAEHMFSERQRRFQTVAARHHGFAYHKA
eukprot:3239967-Karenia_brevis.AAC.1